MKDKQLKTQLIQDGTFNNYRKQRFNMFENKEYDKLEDPNAYYKEDTGETLTEKELNACKQMKKARKKQVSTIRHHYEWWLSNGYKIYFCTFTKSDNFKGSDETFKRYVVRVCGLSFDDYMLNIDYGRENERLHYHALGVVKMSVKSDLKSVKRQTKNGQWITGKKLTNPFLEEYELRVGFYDAEPCKDDIKSAKKLSNYIDKLTLHSVKVKQAYVSTKKGTEYQMYMKQKKAREKGLKRELEKNGRYDQYAERKVLTRNEDLYLKYDFLMTLDEIELKIQEEEERAYQEQQRKIAERRRNRGLLMGSIWK